MTYLYIPTKQKFSEVKKISVNFECKGYDTDKIHFGQSWDNFAGEVPDGATIVVYSVDFFPSLMELLSTLAALQERGIVLKSLQEPWLSEKIGSTTDFLLKLKELALLLHTNRTRAGLAKARAAGKTLGRPIGRQKGGRG